MLWYQNLDIYFGPCEVGVVLPSTNVLCDFALINFP